jgi:hypothetical protein
VSGSRFEDYRADLEAAERRVAREIDPGKRALVVAVLVFVLLVSFLLPHTGSARGVDVLLGNQAAIDVGITLPSRVFCWLSLVFGIGFSMLALLTRRWAVPACRWPPECWPSGRGRPPCTATPAPVSG